MGEYIEPRGSANYFSANNYGDHTEQKSEKGRTVNVQLSVVQLNTCPQWKLSQRTTGVQSSQIILTF